MPMYYRNPKSYSVQVPLADHRGSVHLRPGDVVEGDFFARYSGLEPVLHPLPPGTRIAYSQAEKDQKYQDGLAKLAAVRTKPAPEPEVGFEVAVEDIPQPEPELHLEAEEVGEERDETAAESAAADAVEDEAAEVKQEEAEAIKDAADRKAARSPKHGKGRK